MVDSVCIPAQERGNEGKVDTQDAGALLNQRVGRLKPNKDMASDFIYYQFQSKYVTGVIEKIIFGTDPPNISGQQIESIKIAISSEEERQVMTGVLCSIDKNIEEKQRKFQQTKSLKKSLMQDLLTGKKRVSV